MNYREENQWFITASKLKCYMDSKDAFKKVYIDEVDTSMIKDSKSLKEGTLIDEYILTKDEFFKKNVILQWTKKADLIELCIQNGIEVDKKDTVTILKDKLVWDKNILTDGEVEMVQSVERELRRQTIYDMWGKYEHQKTIIAEYKWHKLKWKIDRLGDKIRDLKTTKDLEYNKYAEKTRFESMLLHTDEYRYGFQLARYALLVYINTNEWKDWVIDAIKTKGTCAYEAYLYPKERLQQIVNDEILPTLDRIIKDIEENSFVDDVVDEVERRWNLINNRYYPLLDSTIQKWFITINE